tara:strand:+ start:908 stop:1987 length:1080 start_codon:yes stop_codon:yes gene_type:complete
MEIVSLGRQYWEKWNEFCIQSDDAWFWHTTWWMEYTLKHNPELLATSKSFFITDGSRILAICPLIMEEHVYQGLSHREFSYSGSYGISPATANELSAKGRRAILRLLFDHIDSLAINNNVERMSLRCSPLSPSYSISNAPQSNWLMRYNLMDVSLNTQVIDLGDDLDNIRRSMRRDIRKQIDNASRSLTVKIFNNENITHDIFEQYRALHCLASGRVTRPASTFEMMYSWIKMGFAVLFGAVLDDEYVGFFFVTTYKSGAYNGSSCRDPNHHKIPIGHFLRWEIARWLKEQDFEYYEIGIQQYNWLLHDFPSQKEINISEAKRGLGGLTIPLFQAEKYYSKEYFMQILQNRVDHYASKL